MICYPRKGKIIFLKTATGINHERTDSSSPRGKLMTSEMSADYTGLSFTFLVYANLSHIIRKIRFGQIICLKWEPHD